MKRITKAWMVVGLVSIAGCYEGLDGPRDVAPADRAAGVGACEELGYAGQCVQGVGIWWENGACRVRDCASEGKTCGLISDEIGWGCLEGTAGSTVFDCSELDYAGECLSGEVLVWTENATCRWADCAARGQSCAWTDTVGYNCVDATGGGLDLVVAGTPLTGNQSRWVEHIARAIVPEMIGTRDERIAKAAVVTWWSLKEGVLDLDDPLSYSNCHFPPDRYIGPLEVCPDPDNAWQVGVAGVQAAWRSLDDVEWLASQVHPGMSTTSVLVDAAATAGFAPDSWTGRSIAESTGRLRLSWLLRDGAVGFEAQYPVVHGECFVDQKSWCFGWGWDTTASFAPDSPTSRRVVDELAAILGHLTP